MARIGNLETALGMLGRAEASMIGDSDAMVCVATAKAVLTDDIETATAIFDQVKAANSVPPSWIYFAEAGIAFMAGQYARSISASHSGPQEISALVFRCLSHAMLGNPQQAFEAHSALVNTFPKLDFARFADHFPLRSATRRRDYDKAVETLYQMLSRERING